MKSDQVKLWYYLKENDIPTFQKVKALMPKPLISAYDSELRVVATKDDLKKIDSTLNKAQNVQLQEDDGCADIFNIKLPNSVLTEPDIVLAYYLLVFPSNLSRQLEQMLPENKKERVIAAMDEISPQRIPKVYLFKLIEWMNLHQPAEGVKGISSNDKAVVLEQLITDSSNINSSLSDAIFNPSHDFFLFSDGDQRKIIQSLIENQALIPFLVFFEPKKQFEFLKVVSKRQQRILLDTLALENKSSYNQIDARNVVISVIRQLQKNMIIDNSVKQLND